MGYQLNMPVLNDNTYYHTINTHLRPMTEVFGGKSHLDRLVNRKER